MRVDASDASVIEDPKGFFNDNLENLDVFFMYLLGAYGNTPYASMSRLTGLTVIVR